MLYWIEMSAFDAVDGSYQRHLGAKVEVIFNRLDKKPPY